MTVAVLSLAFLLIAFIYMVGIGFKLPRVQAWAKNEFYQAVANALIAGFMLILLSSINGLMNSLTGPACFDLYSHQPCTTGLNCKCWCDSTITCPVSCTNPAFCSGPGYSAAFDYTKCFLDSERNRLVGDYMDLLGANFGLGILTSWFQYFQPYQQGISFSLFPGYATVMDFVGLMMTFVGGAAILLMVQSMVLDFIRFKLMALFPIGIALRTFPFTRSAGAAMIALVAGFYVLYPMLFFLGSQMFARDVGMSGFLSCNISFIGINNICPPDRAIYDAFIVGIFYPLFSLTVVISFTREFAKLLGGDIDLSSLTKML